MDVSKIGYWLQVLANIGILIGLIVVGFQMQLDRDLTIAQLKSDSFRQAYELRVAEMGEDPASSFAKFMVDPATVGEEDLLIVEAYIDANLYLVARVASLAESGFYDENWERQVLPGVAIGLGARPYTRERILEIEWEGDWYDKLERLVRDIDPQDTRPYFQERLAAAREVEAQ